MSHTVKLWQPFGFVVNEVHVRPSLVLGNMRWYSVHVYPPGTFYPIHWTEIMSDQVHNASTTAMNAWYQERLRNASTVHVWSKLGSNGDRMETGSPLNFLFMAMPRR